MKPTRHRARTLIPPGSAVPQGTLWRTAIKHTDGDLRAPAVLAEASRKDDLSRAIARVAGPASRRMTVDEKRRRLSSSGPHLFCGNAIRVQLVETGTDSAFSNSQGSAYSG